MSNKLKYIDLFAGCGGLSLGLHLSECWHGLFAVEKSPDAFRTLEHNLISNRNHFSWPAWLQQSHHDINELLESHREHLLSLRGEVDLVAGGPPCQGFSLAGRRVEKDQRNNLVNSYLEFIRLVQPNAILFENVKGFEVGFKQADNTKGIPYSKVVLEKLRNELGYADAQAKVLNFADFGVPQERKRFIIIGTRNGTADQFFEMLESNAETFLGQKGLKPRTSLKNAVSDLRRQHGVVPSETNGFDAGKYPRGRPTPYQHLMRRGAKDLPDSHRFAKHTKRTEEKFSTIIRDRLTSKQVREMFGTRKCSTKLLGADTPTPTLTTLPDDYVHYCEPRILTVREYARIQSFPDWYEFKGKYTTGGSRRKVEVPRYSQIGNAIPPLFGELAGLVLSEIVDA